MTVRFPLVYRAEDEFDPWVLHTPRDVEENVEYVDDYDPAYRCVDADGRRVRLIVWRLQLLLCHRIRDDWRPGQVPITTLESGRHAGSLFEISEDAPTRALVRTRGAGELVAEPTSWQGAITTSSAASMRSDCSPEEFHRLWMISRLRGVFP